MKPQRFPFSVSYWTGDQGQVVDLCAGRNFRFDLDALNHFCLEDLPSRLVDFLRIASSIYVVDRLVKRHPQHGAKRPSRAIGIRVNVLNKPFWSRPEVRDTIGEAVDFVSGDFSDVDFSQDTFRFARSMRMLPNPYDGQPPLICLFSGGQDSAAGLVARLMEGSERIVLPVSVWHQPRQRDLLHKQFGMLRERLPVRIDPLIVKVAMIWSSDLDKKQEERSQRCRSFLFATLGAIAAIMNRQKSVEMFESGVGAINMPLMAGMVGSKATRSSHPQFLRLMSRLASLVAETNIEFCLPFLHRTKGEVTKVLADFGLHALAVKTTSCVGYPLRHSLAKQCGICPACIFRRQAMLTAGISEPNGSYRVRSQIVSVLALNHLAAST